MKIMLRAIVCALLAGFCAGCQSMPGLSDAAAWFSPAKPDRAARLAALENRIFVLIEEERNKDMPNARPLALDSQLTEVARQRSDKMARANSFTDSSGDSHVSASLLMAKDANFQGLVGENVAAQHFLPGTGIDVEDLAKRFVDGWLASKPHKENLLFADYSRTGVGVAANNDTVYVTQLFSAEIAGSTAANSAAPASAPPSQAVPVANPAAGKDDGGKAPIKRRLKRRHHAHK
jgi:uncharacterized protein YkwD